ncbi:uncharacterized protein LOC114725067 [Neltuma alba]|uniref:uncharacterized protein LOC114725067 n=1 Tax=Neltuma alba TaxID=207710 RepID=UPI0010A2CD3B|nr:uncharacterized protein LOC114725067 [Prosopis alba]
MNGLSESQIQSMISLKPQILFSSVDKTLKPKIEYLQLLGFQGYGRWIISNQQRVFNNAAFLKSCGIVGSQLSFLLTHNASLFVIRESQLRSYVSWAVNLGFSINSGMLVHGLRTTTSMSIGKFENKLEVIQSCGFSKDETMQMFRRSPGLLSRSEERLKFKIQVCLVKIMLPKSLLVNSPVILMLSMEKRVIPRWRVRKLLVSKNLLNENPSSLQVLLLQEKKFLKKYISKFRDNEEALLEAYKGPPFGRCFYIIVIIKSSTISVS